MKIQAFIYFKVYFPAIFFTSFQLVTHRSMEQVSLYEKNSQIQPLPYQYIKLIIHVMQKVNSNFNPVKVGVKILSKFTFYSLLFNYNYIYAEKMNHKRGLSRCIVKPNIIILDTFNFSVLLTNMSMYCQLFASLFEIKYLSK